MSGTGRWSGWFQRLLFGFIVTSAAGARAVDTEHIQSPAPSALAINAARVEEREPQRQWLVAGVGFLTYGVVPELAPGIELQLGRELGEHAQLRAGMTGAFAFDVELEDGAGTFDATLVAARVDGCARTALASSLRGGGCFGLLGGALHVTGDEITRTASSTVPWLALSAAAHLDFVLSPSWSIELGVSTRVLLHRVEVGIENTEGSRVQSRQLSQVSFAVGLGPVCYF